MPLHRQPDLFETQADMFGEDAETPTFRPDLDSVRAELQRIIAEARAADKLPPARLTLYRTIVPQMSLWLPEDEAAQLRFEFDAEMERLKAA
jgi:hypothetical protein